MQATVLRLGRPGPMSPNRLLVCNETIVSPSPSKSDNWPQRHRGAGTGRPQYRARGDAGGPAGAARRPGSGHGGHAGPTT